jgi:hypothetical protein
MRRALLCLTTLALTACPNKDKDEPVDTDEPDLTVETADTFQTDSRPDQLPWDSSDTGSLVMIDYVGWAFVDPGVSLNGWETLALSFVKPGGKKRYPGCVLAYEARDWLNDPIRAGQANPLAANLNSCTGCTFTFTVSLTNPEAMDHFPWEDLDLGDDTDQDTDPDTDVEAPRGDGRPLSCATLFAEGYPAPDPNETQWFGYGFNPTLVEPEDPTVGAWMYWYSSEAAWIPYAYEATFVDGVFEWTALYGYYQTY